MENGKPTIDRIDHGVLPSNDLGRAHRFYSTFMGGELDHLTNLNLRGLNLFFHLPGESRIAPARASN